MRRREMALTEVKLTWGERLLAGVILARVEKGDLATARGVKHVRRALDLRQAEYEVGKVRERLEREGFEGLPWDVLVDPSFLAADVRGEILEGIEEGIEERLEELAAEVEGLGGEEILR